MSRSCETSTAFVIYSVHSKYHQGLFTVRSEVIVGWHHGMALLETKIESLGGSVSGSIGRRGALAESVFEIFDTLLDLLSALLGNTLVIARIVIVGAPADGRGVRRGSAVLLRVVGVSETFTGRVETVVDVATDGFACTVDGVEGAVWAKG